MKMNASNRSTTELSTSSASIAALSWCDVPGASRALFDELSTTGGLFVRGLVPRTESVTTIGGGHVYEMHWRDPTTWIALAAILLIPMAIMPFRWTGAYDFMLHATWFAIRGPVYLFIYIVYWGVLFAMLTFIGWSAARAIEQLVR